MQLRRGNQQQPKKNTQVAEYEIKTYISSTGRNRSPNLNNQFNKRSPVRREVTNDSGLGEMAYFEPNEINNRRSINGINETQNFGMRSPIRMAGAVNNNQAGGEYGERVDISRPTGISQYPQPTIGTDSRRDKLSRSPKTINIGETAKDVEYNMKSLNKGRSPVYSNSGQDNPVIERTYNMISNEAGNIFLDQPIHQTSFVNQQEVIDTPIGIGRGSFESKDSRDYGQNGREGQFSMNPRDFHEPLPGILGKMSPKANVDGDSDSNSEKNDNTHQIKDLRTQLEKKQSVQLRSDDGMIEGAKPIQNDIDKIEDLVKNKETRENITEEEVKKLVRLYVKSYDPKNDGEGRLISNSQTVVPSIKDDLFNDRYKVLQKMNKLSNILLSKNRNQSIYEINSLNRTTTGGDERRSFDKNTLNSTVVGGKKGTYRGKHNKFLFVSLAMLSAKGPNAEDRTILRRMRLDKGGVVDLAQENSKKKNKFRIKKVKASGRGQNMINPKYKEKAAKIVQGWWRDQKAKYKNILNQIVKIQSAWRGKFTRKYVYDIIYLSYLHQRFFDIMERTLVNHTRPLVWDELFSRTKIAKATIKRLLERNDTKYSLIRLKPYFHKWKIIANFLRNRILKSRSLVIKKGDEEQKKNILKKYMDKWSLKANLAKYIGKTKDAEEKRQKFFGALDMFNGLKLHTKKVSFQNSNQPIKNYLQDLLKKKLMKKIVNNIGTNFLKMKLRASISKWKDVCHYGKIQDMKADTFVKNITHANSRMQKIRMKRYLDRWRRQVPTGKKILSINDGADLLKKFTLRNLVMDPLAALAEKCDNKNERNKTLALFNIKRRKIRDNLRTFFDRWKNNTIRMEDKDYRNDIYTTLLKNLINNIDRRILYKRFNQWRQRPKIDINNEMAKVRAFSEILNGVFKKNIRSEKYDFLDRLEVTRADRAVQKVTKKIFKNYRKKDRRVLRHYFYKWRGQTKNSEITELQEQLMKYLFISQENRTNRLTLAKYMTRWRLFVSDKKNYDNMEKLKKVYKGGDILGNIKNRRGRDFIIRLYRMMNKDYRPIILDKLTQKLMKPRSSLREIFDRWRRVNDVEKAVNTISTIKGKFFHSGFKHIKERSNRDDLMKAFFRWKIMSRKPDEYYPKITRGFDLLNKYFRANLCEEPFDLIFFARNYERPLKKLLKNYKNQENRLLNGKLRNLFGRWRKLVGDSNISDLKTNIIVKTKNNLENTLKAKTLAKYFTRWKLYRRKGLDVNFSKGIEILTNLYKRPFREDILYAFFEKTNQVCQLKGAENLVKSTNRYSKTLLRGAFIQMWKGAMSIDPNRMKKIKTRLRRIIKHNEIEPRAKAFHRWANQIKLLQFRDKDMEKARKMIGNTLRNNDKMNLNYAMSRWKKKIQQIREQYLKSLLVKQIKSSQIVKEQINNQAKLRAALLKWRAKLAPVNYLDRLKHIRKGCKLFKRGLKKRDERFIFDNIAELAKQNRKTFLLDNIVHVIKPNIDNYKLQNAMNIWRSKLADTQKMKNKMNTLLDDFLYSDKIHEGLIRKPASKLIDLMKNYYQIKKEGAQKISDFVKGVLKAKDNLNKLKATIKLRNLMDKKNKDLDYIKRMQLRRLQRNVQKINNNANAKILQRFIKIKLRKYFDKKALIRKGVDLFRDYLRKRCFDSIADKAKDNQMKKVLIHAINSQDTVNNKTLSNAFTKWKSIIPILRQNEAATKLQNLFRAFKSRQKLNNLEERLDKLANLHQKYEIKNSKILDSHLREWLNRAIMTKNKQNAQRIQRFIRRKVLLHQIKEAKLKLRDLFKNDTKHKLAHVMERSSRIIGGKGEVVYKAVQDLLYRNPFAKLIERMKFLGKVNTLRNIQPKVHDALKRYYLPLAMQKWKENTYDQTVKCTQAIQKFLRDRYEKKLERDRLKREDLLKKFVLKKQKNNLYKLHLPFSVWYKKVRLAEANEGAKVLQTALRGYLGRKRGGELLAKNKFYKLFRINHLKNILEKLKEAGNKKILTTNRKTVLTLIMKRKAYTDDKSATKRYFDKWRQYNKYLHDCASKIANAYRIMKANQEKNRLKRITTILKKSILKHNKVDNDQMRSKLRKWNNKSKFLTYNLNGRRIQRFIKPKLARLLNARFKNFFINNAQKKTSKLLLLAAKFKLLQKSLDRPSLQRFRNNLKKISLMNAQSEKLKKLTINKDSRTNDLLLKKYFQRWKDQNEKINTKRNLSAIMIQCTFRSSKARQYAHKHLTINNMLMNALSRKAKISSNKLYSSFKRWKNTVRNLTLNRNARFIQDFCRDILDRLKEQKELSKKIRLNNGIDQIFRIKYGVRYAFEKLKNKRNEVSFIRFNNNLQKNRINKLKDCFNKLKKLAFTDKLVNLLQIPDAFLDRILKKKLALWREKADKLSHKRGAEIIQKNFKLYLLRKKQENKRMILKDLFVKLAKKHSNILGNAFNKWNNTVKKIKQENAKNIFAKFISNRFKVSEARKKWIKLIKKYLVNRRNDDLFTVVDGLKKFAALNKMKDPFIHFTRVSVIQIFKDRQKKNRIVTKLKKMLPERNDKNGHDTIVKYFKRWKLSAEKYRERLRKTQKAFETLDKRELIQSTNRINAVFLLKKLFNDLPKYRALEFMSRLKQNRDNKKKYDKLKDALEKTKEDLLNQNKLKAMDALYKLFAYRKIDNMFKVLDKNLNNKTKPKFGKELLKRLYDNLRQKSQFNYGGGLESTSKAKMTRLNFKNKSLNNKPTNIIEDKYAPLKKCLPFFVKFIDNRLKDAKRDVLDILKENDREKYFSILIKRYAEKRIKSPKKDVVHVMKRDALYSKTRPETQVKLFKLFRRKYLKELTYSLDEPAKLYKLYYLVNVTIMHKRISQQRFYRELIRKWRFNVFARKMASKKMEIMYKNLHSSYLQMADEFFGDDGINPSVIQEFEMFGNNVGMFTGEQPQVAETQNKKFTSGVVKNYIFPKGQNPKDVRKSFTKKTIVEEEEEEREEVEEKQYNYRGSVKDPFSRYKKK